MEVCKMYWWQHDEKTPAVSSGKIQRGFDIKCKEEHPREFKDYKISWHVDGCKEPEEFDLYKEEDFLQLSGIQHFAFCRRQWHWLT